MGKNTLEYTLPNASFQAQGEEQQQGMIFTLEKRLHRFPSSWY